jgi:AraC-like DNA-binding protein
MTSCWIRFSVSDQASTRRVSCCSEHQPRRQRSPAPMAGMTHPSRDRRTPRTGPDSRTPSPSCRRVPCAEHPLHLGLFLGGIEAARSRSYNREWSTFGRSLRSWWRGVIAAAHHISTSCLRRLPGRWRCHGLGLDPPAAPGTRPPRPGRSHRHAIPIHDIAARWGFTQHAAFIPAFRTAYGITPRDYREDARDTTE